MNRNQLKANANDVKGTPKDAAGKVTGDKSAQEKGKSEKPGVKPDAKSGDLKSAAKREMK